ncbi:MAG: serine hydrolase domain-containing protein, partial [bacterium]
MQASHTPQVRSARATWVLLAYFGIALRSLAIAQPASLPTDLDDYITAAIKEWSIPGAALAIVKDGKPIVVKGYGVTKLGTSYAVNPDTIFDIASLTKSFTAVTIAILVDEGKLDWDTPVREYLPIVQFSDPYLTSNVTLRDLLSHRTGLRNNAAPFRGHLTRAQIVALFKRLPTSEPFRARWVYSNIGYALAGEVAAAVTGSTWEKLVTSRVIDPLGLKRTTAYFDTVPTLGNYAVGHVIVDGSQQAITRGSE